LYERVLQRDTNVGTRTLALLQKLYERKHRGIVGLSLTIRRYGVSAELLADVAIQSAALKPS
jgi:hypothetical protein